MAKTTTFWIEIFKRYPPETVVRFDGTLRFENPDGTDAPYAAPKIEQERILDAD